LWSRHGDTLDYLNDLNNYRIRTSKITSPLSTQAILMDENQNSAKNCPPSALINNRRVEAERLWLPSP
ncbi:MAG: hypothetical protein ACPGQF_10770, partial [Akkermansiaceae bacterium]